jgi:hypothetical protein
MLTYDTRYEGYVVNIDRTQMERAPRYTASSMPEWNRDWRARIDEYWVPMV